MKFFHHNSFCIYVEKFSIAFFRCCFFRWPIRQSLVVWRLKPSSSLVDWVFEKNEIYSFFSHIFLWWSTQVAYVEKKKQKHHNLTYLKYISNEVTNLTLIKFQRYIFLNRKIRTKPNNTRADNTKCHFFLAVKLRMKITFSRKFAVTHQGYSYYKKREIKK